MPRKTNALDRDHGLAEHLRGLGLGSIDEYRTWCSAQGFSRRLDKSEGGRVREIERAREIRAADRLRVRRRSRRGAREQLEGLCDDRIAPQAMTGPRLQRIARARGRLDGRKKAADRKAFSRLALHLDTCRAKLFEDVPAREGVGHLPGNTYLDALVLLARSHRSWLRPVESFVPRSHNVHRQFSALVRHLLVRYEMPAFFDSAWFEPETAEGDRIRDWTIFVGRGQNIRHADLPLPYTRKMAHQFMRAPGELSVPEALRWGQVVGSVGDPRLALAVVGSRIGREFGHEPFWASVIRWFAEHPMLDRTHVGPIIDYLYTQRFQHTQTAIGPGRVQIDPPPQPNLTMKGRDPDRLLAQVTAWHRELSRISGHQNLTWVPSGLPGLTITEGQESRGNRRVWTVSELTSSRELLEEGRKMRHCVASYAPSCAQRTTSIWSMVREDMVESRRCLTLEVQLGRRIIVQARGHGNRVPTATERAVMERWAGQAGLRIATYV